MVRKGSTVRVRARALQASRLRGVFLCPEPDGPAGGHVTKETKNVVPDRKLMPGGPPERQTASGRSLSSMEAVGDRRGSNPTGKVVSVTVGFRGDLEPGAPLLGEPTTLASAPSTSNVAASGPRARWEGRTRRRQKSREYRVGR
jgi:hypothetical protein